MSNTLDFENLDYWDYKEAIKGFLFTHYEELYDYFSFNMDDFGEVRSTKIDAIWLLQSNGAFGLVDEVIKYENENCYIRDLVDNFIDQYDISAFQFFIETEEEKKTHEYNTEQEGKPVTNS